MAGTCLALVRFPDGTVLTGSYQGTSDVLAGELVDVGASYAGLSYLDPMPPADHPDAVDVEAWASYANGYTWTARALLVPCPHGDLGCPCQDDEGAHYRSFHGLPLPERPTRGWVVAGFDPFVAPGYADGTPQWVHDAFDVPEVETP